MDESSARAVMPASTHRAQKVCHRCGRDVAGQRRYRDQSGYWCVPCAKADRKAYRANHLPCDDCGTDIKRGEERLLEDYRLCDICYQKRQTETIRRDLRAQAAAEREVQRLQRRRRLRQWSILAVEIAVGGVVLWRLFASSGAGADDPASPPTTQPMPAAAPSGRHASALAAAWHIFSSHTLRQL